MSGYFDRNGAPMTLEAWRKTFDDAAYKRVASDDDVAPGVDVSPVWLGLDHRFGLGEAAPLIFETMIFGGKHDGYCERYSTEAEALEGHARAVALARGMSESAP